MPSNNNGNSTTQQRQEEEERIDVPKDNPYFNDVKLTVIVGPPADKMIQSLKRGNAFSYVDKSVEGVPILEVWVEVDKGFWWD